MEQRDNEKSTYAGEIKTGMLLSFPRIVVLASASATFRRILGRKWIFWYASAFWFFATQSAIAQLERWLDILISSSPAEA
jgi:hypothetical protein